MSHRRETEGKVSWEVSDQVTTKSEQGGQEQLLGNGAPVMATGSCGYLEPENRARLGRSGVGCPGGTTSSSQFKPPGERRFWKRI